MDNVTVVKAVKKPTIVKKAVKKTAISKKVLENTSKYGKRIKQLKVITEDRNYIPGKSTSKYHEFIRSMYGALIIGRKITPKMESAITKIVKSYAEWLKKENDPEYRNKKLDYIDNTMAKINMIKRRLSEANYHTIYENRSEFFLNSVHTQVSNGKVLSVKQRKALNQMYKRFKKRIEKNENKA